MVTVSSAFISSRRERIIFRVLSASGCACKTTAGVDVLRAFGKTDLDNTDVARDHFLSLYRERRIPAPADYTTNVGLMVSNSSNGLHFTSGLMLSSYHPGSSDSWTTGPISCR